MVKHKHKHILWKKTFYHKSLKFFSTEKILKHQIKDCFKINGKQIVKIPKKGEYVKFKNFVKNDISRF